MSLLRDFVGSFASNIGAEMYQREADDRALKLQEELENRRILRQQEAETRRRLQQNEDKATELNMAGAQIGTDDDGRPSLLRFRAEADPASGALRVSKERIGDAPVTPVGRPMTIYDGDNRRSVQRYSDGSEKDLGAPSPVRAARGASGSGGSSAKDRYELRNIGGRVMRVNVTTGEQTDMGPASKDGSGKGESADEIRAKWTDTATKINAAEGEALRSIAAQYGMDQRGLPTDDETLKAAILGNVEAEFGERLKRASGGKESGSSKPGSSQDNPAPASAFKGEPPSGTWVKLPSGKVIQVP